MEVEPENAPGSKVELKTQGQTQERSQHSFDYYQIDQDELDIYIDIDTLLSQEGVKQQPITNRRENEEGN